MHRFQLHWSLALEIIPGPSPCAVLSPASRTWTSCCLIKRTQGWRKCLHAQVKRLTTPFDRFRQHGDFGGRRLVKGSCAPDQEQQQLPLQTNVTKKMAPTFPHKLHRIQPASGHNAMIRSDGSVKGTGYPFVAYTWANFWAILTARFKKMPADHLLWLVIMHNPSAKGTWWTDSSYPKHRTVNTEKALWGRLEQTYVPQARSLEHGGNSMAELHRALLSSIFLAPPSWHGTNVNTANTGSFRWGDYASGILRLCMA